MKKYLVLLIIVLCADAAIGQNINTIAGTGTFGFSGDGSPATAAQFQYIWYSALGAGGSIFISDNSNHRIRKIDGAGNISTFAGDGLPGFSGDGGQATAAHFYGAAGITVDAAGNVYFADKTNHRIRKVNTAGVISTIAGTGAPGFGGDGGAAISAVLNAPYGLLCDATGSIYVGDVGNNRVRRINAAGVITTVAGIGAVGYTGDGGPATAARLSSPACIAKDFQGNIYIADVNNNCIRKVDVSGIITTVAGNGTAGYSGDGGPAIAAMLNQPLAVAVDGIGNLFISDQFNNRIRMVDRNGIITTMAGTGIPGYGGDGGPALSAQFYNPFGIINDTTGNLYICDWGNFRLRKIDYNNHMPSFVSGLADSFTICENDGLTAINSLMPVTDPDTAQTLTWTVISGPMHGAAFTPFSTSSTGGAIVPSGLFYTPATGYSGRDTFRVMVDDGYAIDTLIIYVRIKPLPSMGPIVGPDYVCIGSPVNYTDTAAGGVWSMSNPNATITTTGIVHGLQMGLDTITYTHTIAGCVTSATKSFEVFPVSDTIVGITEMCQGMASILTGIPSGGTWSSVSGVVSVTNGYVLGLVPGIDTITYTVTNPCGTFSHQQEVIVTPLVAPFIDITAAPGPFILPGQSDTLYANITTGAGPGYDYQWQLNGTDIPGATNSYYISDTLRRHDSVTCIVTNGPCRISSFGWIYIDYVNIVPMTELYRGQLYVSPNPSNGIFTAEGTLEADNNTAILEIADVLGRVVYRDVIQVVNGNFKKQIDIGDRLKSGMYLLRVCSSGGQKAIRFSLRN